MTTQATLLKPGKASFSIDYQDIQFDSISDNQLALASQQGEDIHSTDSVNRTSINLTYGLNKRLALGVSVPYIERHGMRSSVHEHADDHEDESSNDLDHDHHDQPDFLALGDASGLGDARAFGVWQLWEQPESGASLLFGVKAPTGDTHETGDNGERLETELQPGSGSWDGFVGIAYSRTIGKWSMDVNLLYTRTSEGSQETELGDIANYNFSLSLPLNQHEHHDHSHDHQDQRFLANIPISLVMEINGEWRDQSELGGKTEKHSGGNIMYFSPGVNITVGDWYLSGSVGIPYVDLQGIQGEPETRVLLRIGKSF